MLGHQPKAVKIAALLDKISRRTQPIQGDYVGFEIPDEFVVGYGLDFAERYRNLPEVCVLETDDRVGVESRVPMSVNLLSSPRSCVALLQDWHSVAGLIDHTLLSPAATRNQVISTVRRGSAVWVLFGHGEPGVCRRWRPRGCTDRPSRLAP